MAFLRFIIVLALRAAVLLFGLALVAYAVFQAGGAIQLLTAANAQPPLLFLVPHFAMLAGLLAVGLGMMWFGISGIIERFRQGLPKDEEGMGKSPGARVAQALVYGAGFLFGAFSLAVSGIPGAQMAMLVANGVTVDAKVTGFEATDDPHAFTMNYAFRLPSGVTMSDTVPATTQVVAPSTEVLPRVRVTYLPDDPSVHAVTQFYSHEAFAFFVISRLLITLVGLWGVIRNTGGLSLRSIVPSPAPAPPMPPASPAVARPQAAGRRTTFGRRGA